MSRAIIVIPNHLDNLDFLGEWKELAGAEIIVVQDIGAKPAIPVGYNVTIYDHADIEADLGDKAWIIPSCTSACRSYGYYKAWQRHPDYIITLDNDCFPDRDPLVATHVRMLQSPGTLDWVNAVSSPYTRGFPYLIRDKAETVINHGLWSNVPDLDGATMLHLPNLRFPTAEGNSVVPRWNYMPVCGMNLAWKAELTPALYFGLFGPDYGFDQYDDLFAGVIVKKIIDHLGLAMRSGIPSVEHRKQSNAFANLKKQAPGLAMNENFWQAVRDVTLTKDNIIDCYEELINGLPDVIQDEPEGYTKRFKETALLWLDLYR